MRFALRILKKTIIYGSDRRALDGLSERREVDPIRISILLVVDDLLRAQIERQQAPPAGDRLADNASQHRKQN